jgi:IS4 transposase
MLVDRTAANFPFWPERKAGMCLEVGTEQVIDVKRPINQDVTANRVVTGQRGLRVREITFCKPCDGAVYVYLTSETTLETGQLALLYKTRWEIEKVFDEKKTKLAEKKSWATTTEEMQTQLVTIVHNLLLLLQDWHQQLGVANTAKLQRWEKRPNQQQTELKQTGQTLPLISTLLLRITPLPSNSSAFIASPH